MGGKEMSEASQINDGAAGPSEKPVFNPKQPEKLSTEVVKKNALKLGEKIIYILGAGMKRHVIVKKPDGKELIRIPLTLFILFVILTQLFLLIVSAVLVVFFKWKIELEEPKLPGEKENEIKKDISNIPATSAQAKTTLPPVNNPNM